MTIVKRTTKGSALTYAEMDENFRDLDEDMTLDRILNNGNVTSRGMSVDSAHITNLSCVNLLAPDFAAGSTTDSSITDGTKTLSFNDSNYVMSDTFIVPSANGTLDLGTPAKRWRNIYTSDLNLNNGIGDYTIVEGEEDLFLYNNKSGRVFKFALVEVDPNVATPKIKDL
jgi:hypothetical protein